MTPREGGTPLQHRLWEGRAFRTALWTAVLVALILAATVLESGSGRWVAAVLGIVLVLLGAAVAPELSGLAGSVRMRVLDGRSSSLGLLRDPVQTASELAREVGASTAGEPGAAELRAALERQLAGSRGDRLILLLADQETAKRVVQAAFAGAGADAFQCLVPARSADVVSWLKGGEPDLPARLDPRKPTVVLLGDFADYRRRGVEPADFAHWTGPRCTALGWAGRHAGDDGWLDPFYGVACVIDVAEAARREPR